MDWVATMTKFCAAIALAWIPVTFAQTVPPTAQENPVISTRSSLVLVPALVRTGSGQLVYTLTANDFTITDDGVEQRVSLDEDTDDQPLALAIVVEGVVVAVEICQHARFAMDAELCPSQDLE